MIFGLLITCAFSSSVWSAAASGTRGVFNPPKTLIEHIENCETKVVELGLSHAQQRKLADFRVARYVIENRQIPRVTPDDLRSIGVNIKQWAGYAPYTNRPKERFHPSPSRAWAAVRKIVEDTPENDEFTFAIKAEIIQMLKKKEFTSLPIHRRKKQVSQVLASFGIEHGRLPRTGFQGAIDEWKELGVHDGQWRGSRQYSQTGPYYHNRFHDSYLDALIALREVTLAIGVEGDQRKERNKELFLNQINREIDKETSSSTADLAEKTNQAILEFILKNKRRPKMSSPDDFLDLHIVYNQRVGGGRYQKGGERHKQALHSSKEEAWNQIVDMLLAYPIHEDDPFGFTEADRLRVLEEIEAAKIFKSRSVQEVRAAYDKAGLDYFLENGRFPSTSSRENFKAIGINHHRWFGWGIFRPDTESGTVGHLRVHDSRADAYKSVFELLNKLKPSTQFSQELLNQRRQQLEALIQEVEAADWERSIYGRPE